MSRTLTLWTSFVDKLSLERDKTTTLRFLLIDCYSWISIWVDRYQISRYQSFAWPWPGNATSTYLWSSLKSYPTSIRTDYEKLKSWTEHRTIVSNQKDFFCDSHRNYFEDTNDKYEFSRKVIFTTGVLWWQFFIMS